MTTLIRAARLADGLSTSSKANQAVLVTEDRIQAVGSAEEIIQNARRYVASG